MNKKTLILIIVFFTMTLCSCAKEKPQEPSQSSIGEPLVYLNVERAACSSFDDTPDWAPLPDPMAPVDRNMLTRWSPKLGLDNEWIYFDFGKPKVLSKIKIVWEKAHAVDYEILISAAGKNWKRLLLMTEQDGGIDEIEFSGVETRFVKLIGLKRNNPDWGFSMWEFEMYGPGSLNPEEKAEKKPFEEIEKKKREFEKASAEFKGTLTPLTLGEFHKGVVYTSWSADELGSLASDLTLLHLRKIGVRHIAIMVPLYQETVDSKVIFANDFTGGDTPKDEAIIHTIKTCHLLGIKVMLKPHVDCRDETFRGDILPSEEWFESYKSMILRYAKLAQENDVEIFCIGTELENTTFFAWEDEWREIIASIKKFYKGFLVYSANWSEYEKVSFWDLTDFIGIDAYFPLTAKNDPTEEELARAWNGVADRIEEWLRNNNPKKKVIFTELGYVSSDGTNKKPWATLTNPEDQTEQAQAIHAALTVLSERKWFKGMYLWQYFPQERWSPLGYPVRGKKAEKILSEWYGKRIK